MSDMRNAIEDIREENKKLKAENEKMRVALEFYADEESYGEIYGRYTERRAGSIARKALAEIGGGNE